MLTGAVSWSTRFGFCGPGEDHCGADCIANCDYESTAKCSATKPCAEGCCSKFGICGYGPDYCSKDNCVSGCGQPSESDPGDWGSEFANSTTCPLNVCCSKYGFCGTKGKLQRAVGYYESSAKQRSCNAFLSEQIPKGIYTHLNYAFATIDPNTFEILPPTSSDANLMQRLTSLKQNDRGLRVNIAIGGWSFNDPGITSSIFTELAASEANQRKFFKSLTSFLATYDFDGVDIDWEYPVDSDRGGREEDYKNFPKFMANLKSALMGTGGRDRLSLTLPTSYWYLRHFDIKSLAKSVDYFNYISYDLHGTWDRGNKWTGEYLDAHTNLTEITDSLDLLWRNDISPDKVVLGIAFYSRAFTVADTNCMTPGCLFGSGSTPGPCSRQTGILMNSEIDDIRAKNSLTPSLDKDAAVQILTWDNQWASYDDGTTFKLRIDFAKKTCLGGVMVWAVSHDTSDAAYSRALGGLAPLTQPVANQRISANWVTITVDERKRQCKWTACGQTYTGDYVAISRSDPKYRQGELVLDSIDCPKGSSHTLCCPKEDIPKCGWYTHKNGNCNSECPSGYFEIGSLSSKGLCYNDGYEAACCESGKDSTALYDTLQWSKAPSCDSGECPVLDENKSETLALATSGSGDDKKTWDDCDWYHSVDSPPKGKSQDYCVDSCPSDMHDSTCKGGTRAFCCSDNYYITKVRTDPMVGQFKKALNNYLTNGTCPMGSSSGLSRRDSASTDLVKRDTNTYDNFQLVIPILYSLLQTNQYLLNKSQLVEQSEWDEWALRNSFSGLSMKSLRPYAETSSLWSDIGGGRYVAENILCRPDVWSDLAQQKSIPACQGDPCDEGADPELCQTAELDGETDSDDDDDDDDEDDPLEKRELGYSPLRPRSPLEKRSDPKTFRVWCAGTGNWVDDLKIKPAAYPSAGKWKPGEIQYEEARTYQSRQDCANPLIDPMQKQGNNYDTEHVLELQIIGMFFEYATQGELASGSTPSFLPIDCSFFLNKAQGDQNFLEEEGMDEKEVLYTGEPKPRSAKDGRKARYRIMAALGTTTNKKNFYLLEKAVNGMKARISRNVDLVESTKWKKFVADTSNPGIPLKEIKAAIAVWHYLNNQQVKDSFVEIVSNLRGIWTGVDKHFNQQVPLFLPAWDEWWHDYIDYQADRTSTWVTNGIAAMRKVWQDESDNDPAKLIVLSALDELESVADESVRYSHFIFP
ncbi:class V chitinase [Aspergillus sclerotioniger CBS 115572]|uniref:chitinase n=1 Tax=Aspergillus sclerotioniger CBS 115572 TaxID=1450535 RepID=A0A317V109_9EURO|nr:class V chitinase [Aspergillus sclerotioniger CBS 115572]PWY66472.1 class V chitinase [Aspergillus sclerotioniger CBS 115572]